MHDISWYTEEPIFHGYKARLTRKFSAWCLKFSWSKTMMPRWKTTDMYVISRSFIVFTLVFLILVSFTDADHTVGLLIPMYKAFYQQKGLYYASAINIAMDEINRQENLLPGKNISFIWNNTDCEDENRTIRALMYQIYEAKVSAIIGPGCTCNTSARNAAAFNVPMISYVSTHFLFTPLMVLVYLRLFISLSCNFTTRSIEKCWLRSTDFIAFSPLMFV